jgi:hypothetical protein
VTQVPTRLDHVAYPALQLLGLGEAAVRLAVPERGTGYLRCWCWCWRWRWRHSLLL